MFRFMVRFGQTVAFVLMVFLTALMLFLAAGAVFSLGGCEALNRAGITRDVPAIDDRPLSRSDLSALAAEMHAAGASSVEEIERRLEERFAGHSVTIEKRLGDVGAVVAQTAAAVTQTASVASGATSFVDTGFTGLGLGWEALGGLIALLFRKRGSAAIAALARIIFNILRTLPAKMDPSAKA